MDGPAGMRVVEMGEGGGLQSPDLLAVVAPSAFVVVQADIAPRQAIVRSLLDDCPDEPVDLKHRHACPLPLLIICEPFGLTDPREQGVLREPHETTLNIGVSGTLIRARDCWRKPTRGAVAARAPARY
ncbi:cytochrome P450 [Streptomyces sp. E5N91]|uniref:cytochrome P450 n=1 Tax=Streptomyces sp. E5N91 TaxID=1851996 RepID=UPI001EE80E38|nr:cytochrome P450 [Streptomyces sp. E5N91]